MPSGRHDRAARICPPGSRVGSPHMTEVDKHGRVEPPIAADEIATLTGFLDFQRATLAWKCGGLDAAGLAATVARSSMTLGGMLKHLAFVEDDWFTHIFANQDDPPPWDAVDWDADRDWDWHSAAGDSPQQLMRLWEAATARSRAVVSEAARQRWPGSARGACLVRRPGTEPALDPMPHDRGVRASQRTRRSDPGVSGRADRRIAASRRRPQR